MTIRSLHETLIDIVKYLYLGGSGKKKLFLDCSFTSNIHSTWTSYWKCHRKIKCKTQSKGKSLKAQQKVRVCLIKNLKLFKLR